MCLTNQNKAKLDGCPCYDGIVHKESYSRPWQEQFGKVVYQYWSCPIHFLCPTITEWFDEYKFYKEDFPSSPLPSFKEINPMWIKAYQYYEIWYNKYKKIVHERETIKTPQ